MVLDPRGKAPKTTGGPVIPDPYRAITPMLINQIVGRIVHIIASGPGILVKRSSQQITIEIDRAFLGGRGGVGSGSSVHFVSVATFAALPTGANTKARVGFVSDDGDATLNGPYLWYGENDWRRPNHIGAYAGP